MDLQGTLIGALGLSEKEAQAYLALLELGVSTVKPIADRAGIARTSIYNFIDQLVEAGLVTRVTIRGRKYYQAAPPERLLEIATRRTRALEENLSEFRRIQEEATKNIVVQYFEGPEEVKNIVREEPRCVREARYIWPGKETMEMIGGADFMTQIDKERIDKGVFIRVIRFRQKDQTFQTSAHGKKFLRALRFAPAHLNVSMGMGIYDTGKVSFFSSKKEGFGLMIESQELVELMSAFYELLWKDCIPAREGEG